MLILGLDLSNINNYSWLSGISDADTSFQVSLVIENYGLIHKIKCFYRLELRQKSHRDIKIYLINRLWL